MIGRVEKICLFTRSLGYQHIAAALLAVGIVASVMWTRREPIVLLDLNLTPTVKPGGTLVETATIMHMRADCRSTISVEMIDAQTVHYRLSGRDAGRASQTGLVRVAWEYSVPFAIAPGPAQLLVQRTYFCWPFGSTWPFERPQRIMTFEVK